MPNHEPRGCSRGASYSWYLYSGNRLKYPLVRARLVELWRSARQTMKPVQAWASIVSDPDKRRRYTSIRGRGGFVGASWDEVTEIIAAANIHTIKTYGPDRIGLLSDSGHVDGLLRRGYAISVAPRRDVPRLLRLVLRSAAGPRASSSVPIQRGRQITSRPPA